MSMAGLTIRTGVVNAILLTRDRPDAEAILDLADSYLTFTDPTARFRQRAMETKTRRKIEVQSEYRLFDRARGAFPAGWVPALAKVIREDMKLDVVIDDARVAPVAQALPISDPRVDFLRADPRYAFQVPVVEAILRAERGIVRVATGGGKTQIAAAAMALLRGNWVFVVNTKDLLQQARERFARLLGEPIGALGDGQKTLERVTVAIVNTLWREGRTAEARALIDRADGVAFDECHGAAAEGAIEALGDMRRARWRLGFSATPTAREDKRSVFAVAALGPLIARVDAPQLIEAGVLARPEIRMICHDGDSPKKTWRGAESDLIVKSRERNELVASIAAKAAKPAIVFVRAIAHGKALTKALARKGLDVDFAWGESDREKILSKLRTGQIEVMVCSAVMTAGVDIPALRAVIIAGGGKSAIEAIQRIGRGSRAIAGKDSYQVWDIFDRGNKWTRRHAAERRKAYLSEGHEVFVEEPDGSKGRTTAPKTSTKWASGEAFVAALSGAAPIEDQADEDDGLLDEEEDV